MLSRCLLFALFLCYITLSHAEDGRKRIYCFYLWTSNYSSNGRTYGPYITGGAADEDSCVMQIGFEKEGNKCNLKPEECAYSIVTSRAEGLTTLVIRNVTIYPDYGGFDSKKSCQFRSNDNYSFHGFHQFAQLIRDCSKIHEAADKRRALREKVVGQGEKESSTEWNTCTEQLIEDAKHLFERRGAFYVNLINKVIEDHKQMGVPKTTTTEEPDEVYDYDYGVADANVQQTTTRNASKNSLMAVLVVGLVSMTVQ